MSKAPPPSVPFGEVLGSHIKPLLAGTFGVIACFAIYYICTAFALGYGTTSLGYSRTAFLGTQLVAILFMALGIILAGWLSDVLDPQRVLIGGCVAGVAVGLLLAPLLQDGSLVLIALFLSLGLLAMGFVYGPLGAWLPALFPARVRYTGASIAFNVGGILGGGLTPIIAQALADGGGLIFVGLYLAIACSLSLVALILIRR